jgi:hypothetical protein
MRFEISKAEDNQGFYLMFSGPDGEPIGFYASRRALEIMRNGIDQALQMNSESVSPCDRSKGDVSHDTTQQYWQTVQIIAEQCKQEYPDPNDDKRDDYIHARIAGSYWVRHYHANEVVLAASDNEPDWADIRSMTTPDAEWRELRQVAAYLAMEQDVWQALRDQGA